MIFSATIIVGIFIFNLVLVLSLVFFFSIDNYRKLSKKLDTVIVKTPVFTFLEKRNVDFPERWLTSNNRKTGLVLIAISLYLAAFSFVPRFILSNKRTNISFTSSLDLMVELNDIIRGAFKTGTFWSPSVCFPSSDIFII